jgi:hypothetical protein
MSRRYDIPRWKHGGFTRKVNEWPEAEIATGFLHCDILAVDASASTATKLVPYLNAAQDLNIMGVSFYDAQWDSYYGESIVTTPESGFDRVSIQDCGEAAVRVANDFNGATFGEHLFAETDTQTIEGSSMTVTVVQQDAFTAWADTANSGAAWRVYQAEEMKTLGKAMVYQASSTSDDTYIYCQLTVLRPYIVVPSA